MKNWKNIQIDTKKYYSVKDAISSLEPVDLTHFLDKFEVIYLEKGGVREAYATKETIADLIEDIRKRQLSKFDTLLKHILQVPKP